MVRFCSLRAAVRIALLVLSAHSVSSTVFAGPVLWVNPVNGDFDTGSNWSTAAIPGSGDEAVFDLGGAYSVTFQSATTNQRAIIRNDDVKFDLGNQNYSLTTSAANVPALIVGQNPADVANLLILNGSVSAVDTSVGFLAGTEGTLTVSTNAALTNSANFVVGDNGIGTLNIVNGGTVTNIDAMIGGGIGVGTATVDGAGSSWQNSGNLTVGGHLDIINGATVTSAQGTVESGAAVLMEEGNSTWANSGDLIVEGFVGLTGGSGVNPALSGANGQIKNGGLVHVKLGSSWANSDSLYIGGSDVASAGDGTLLILGGVLDVANTLKVWDGGVLDIFDGTLTTGSFDLTQGTLNFSGGELRINGGSFDSSQGTLNLGSGEIIVDAGTYMGSDQFLGGTLSLINGTTAALPGDFSVGNGTVNIRSGSVLSSTNTSIVGVANVTDAGSSWQNSGNLLVEGDLNVSAGGAITNVQGTIDNDGTVTVTGAGSTWANTAAIVVGDTTAGTLNVTSGASVNGSALSIGLGVGSSGTVTVAGLGAVPGSTQLTLSSGGDLSVGQFGAGTLDIEDGGTVALTAADVGIYASGVVNLQEGGMLNADNIGVLGGTFTVDKVSSMNLTGTLNLSTGTLNITDDDLVIGTGELLGETVDLLASMSLSVSGTLSIQAGSALTLSGGSLTADSIDDSTGAFDWAASAGTLRLTSASGLTVGAAGFLGDDVSVSANQSLQVDSVTIVDPLATLTVDGGTFTTGGLSASAGTFDFAEGELNIVGGNFVDGTADLIVDGSTGAAVLQLSNGAAVARAGNARIGESGIGVLSIANGATVTNTSAFIGAGIGVGSASVDGAGSTWTNTDSVYVAGNDVAAGVSAGLSVTNDGSLEVANTLKVWDQGRLNLNGGTITTGRFDPSLGTFDFADGELTIDGGTFTDGNSDLIVSSTTGTPILRLLNGAAVTLPGTLTVGDFGNGQLRIASGATVMNTDALIGKGMSAGSASVDGADTTWQNSGDMYIYGFLAVENGATVTSQESDIVAGSVRVAGAGSSWQNSDDLSVSGTLSINNGGYVSNQDGFVYEGGAVTVDGAGATWQNNGNLLVADQLRIYRGGSVSNAQARIDGDAGVVLSGANSNWTTTDSLYVGGTLASAGEAGLISIADGTVNVANTLKVWDEGTVNLLSGVLTTGSFDASVGTFNFLGGELVIEGGTFANDTADLLLDSVTGSAILRLNNGATAALPGTVTVGENGSGELLIMNGSMLSNTDALIGKGVTVGSAIVYGSGSVTVSGPGSTWQNSGDLKSNGSLTITDGGSVSNAQGSIDNGGDVTVEGAGSVWTNTDSLFVGGTDTASGMTGMLTVNADGTVDVNGTVKLWEDGTINLYDGVLEVGTLDVTTGTFNFTGGTLIGDAVLGDLLNTGGTVGPGHSPGTMTVSGNYSQDYDSALLIEIAGSAPGVEYDVLDISGDVALDGVLRIDMQGGFIANSGDFFDILFASSISGTFDTITGDGPGGTLRWDIEYLFNGAGDDIVRITAAVPVPAAIWLFGSALGLLSWLQRNARQVYPV